MRARTHGPAMESMTKGEDTEGWTAGCLVHYTRFQFFLRGGSTSTLTTLEYSNREWLIVKELICNIAPQMRSLFYMNQIQHIVYTWFWFKWIRQ